MNLPTPDSNAPIKMEYLPTPQIFKLLASGFLANVLFSILSGSLLLAWFAFPLVGQGLPELEIQKQLMNVTANPWFFNGLLVTGWLGAMVGGFVAGKLAKQQELLYAAMLGVVSLALTLIMIIMGSSAESETQTLASPIWLIIVSIIIDFWATLQGGKFAKKMRKLKLQK